MPLSPDDWRRLEALFEDALALPASRRREYLAGACPDNLALQQEVERLLASDERATTFSNRPSRGRRSTSLGRRRPRRVWF